MLKIDRRKGPRPKEPFCEGEHSWKDYFIPKGGERLVRECKFCPATLSKNDWLKMNPIVELPRIIREKRDVKSFISLFY